MRTLPANFKTELEGQVMTVYDTKGGVLKIFDVSWLARRCLNGTHLDSSEREACAAALLHLAKLCEEKVCRT
jgi:hypothetical protein